MNERIVDPSLSQLGGEESAAELALRPKSLDEFIGQHRVRDQLTVLLHHAPAPVVTTPPGYIPQPDGLDKELPF